MKILDGRRKFFQWDVNVKITSERFQEGDEVKVTAGLFEGFTGTVQAISEDKQLVTVLVKRGRRDMPVEIESAQLERIDA